MPMHGEKLVAYQRAYRERNREKLRVITQTENAAKNNKFSPTEYRP